MAISLLAAFKFKIMLTGLLHAHSGFRWIVLVLIIVVVFMSLLKWRSNAPFLDSDRKLNFFTMLATHIQLLLGLGLFFLSSKVVFSAETMKEPTYRFYTVEHSIMMLLAVALVTFGYVKSKKAVEDVQKFRTTFVYFLIALVVLLAGIPWPFRGLGAGWF